MTEAGVRGQMTDGKKITKVICPTCKKETRWEDNSFRPFCSERCRLIDLGKWASEDYRIPGEKSDSPRNDRDEKK
jgi:endogenous inhibitor of DNA gyrase (YacG/DUF329 family)